MQIDIRLFYCFTVLLFAFLHVTSLYLLRMHNFVQEMHVTEFAYLFLFIFFFL